MRLLRYNDLGEPIARARTGALIAPEVIGDLRAGYACWLAESGEPLAVEIAGLHVPADVTRILHLGASAMAALGRARAWLEAQHARAPDVRGLQGESLFTRLGDARLHNPSKPGRILIAEPPSSAGGPPRVTDWAPASVMGPVRDLPLPRGLEALHQAPGLAIVIGRRCRAVAQSDALGCVAGYAVANAVTGMSAGEAIPFRRCILGPWLTTPEEAGDVDAQQAVGRTESGSDRRGRATPASWPVARLVAVLSVHGLEPGDAIVSVPSLEARDAGSRLIAGDLLETEVDGLGATRNRVVAEP